MSGETCRNELVEAREAHRSGQLATARAAYERLLEQAPGDADLLGLLGVLEMQQGRPAQAGERLRAALAGGGEPRVHLRNLNNLLALLQSTGETPAARDLVAEALPDWPQGAVPDASERLTLLSLGNVLLQFGRAEAARRLLEAAFPRPGADAEALGLTARALLAAGEAEAAAAMLERAAALAPGDWQVRIALSHARQQLGQTAEAAAVLKQVARAHPYVAFPAQPSQRATVLLLTPPPAPVGRVEGGLHALHATTNFASQFATALGSEFRFLSVFAEAPPENLPRDLPRVDVILNNCVDPETMNVPGRLDRVTAMLERVGAPAINSPGAVFASTRQKVATLLEGIPGLRIPRIERYRLDLAPRDEIAADIERRFGYPVILRRCQAHTSARLQYREGAGVVVLAEDAAALRDCLEHAAWQEIYAIEYVALRRPDGQFRKIRAVLAEDDIIVAIPSFGPDWMVGGGPGNPNWVNFYRGHPELVEECRQIVRDPERHLGAACLRVMEAIRARMPLDFFGVDFDIDEAGEVVLFEANAAMNILKRPNEPADQTLPDEPFERIKAAFRRAVARRM